MFIIIYFWFNEITYMVAVDQQSGLNKHISSGILCWIHHVIMLFVCTWYFGILCGTILWILTLFTISHITLGWLFNLPDLLAKTDNTFFLLANIRASSLIFIIPILFLFGVISVLKVEYKSLLIILLQNTNLIWISILTLLVGFVIRTFISTIITSK